MKLMLLKKNLLLILLSAFIFLLFTACSSGGDDGDYRTQAWVRIDSPIDGALYISDSMYTTGNAAMRDGTYPETVYWFSNTGSGIANSYVGCLFVCISAWEATIPLVIGKNTITVNMLDGYDSVTVTKMA